MSKQTAAYNILLPMTREDRRFMRAINKVRLFFYEEPVKCIPCTTDFMNILFGTKNMKLNRVKIIHKKFELKFAGFSLPFNNSKMYIKFVGSKDKRLKLLADYLRTEVVELGKDEYVVRLPNSIVKFVEKNRIEKYIDSPFASLEEQIKITYGNKKDADKFFQTIED